LTCPDRALSGSLQRGGPIFCAVADGLHGDVHLNALPLIAVRAKMIASRLPERTMKRLYSPIIALALVLAAAVLTACATRASYVDLYGQPAPVSAAERTIVITPDTRYVNVTGGETVGFVVGDKSFAWNFFVARTVSNFPLNDIAPPGVLDHPVQVYVAPDPRYLNGGGHDGHGGHGGGHR
jgi:hypothetical protein